MPVFLMLYAMPARGSGRVIRSQAVVVLAAKAHVEQEVAHRDGILRIERVLVDIVRAVEAEQIAAAREIERDAGRAANPGFARASQASRNRRIRINDAGVGRRGSPSVSMQTAIESLDR